MRFNFKKIAAIGASLVLTGMSMGMAAAASFPDGYSASNTAIVYGAGATLDVTPATSIQSALGTSGGSVSVSGESVNLDYGTSSKIYLNTSLTTAHTIYTSTDLPTVLADSTFSGDVSATVKQKITMVAASGTGAANTGAVIFGKEPTSSVDGAVGLTLGTSSSQPLYNATVDFGSAVNFTNTQSQGQVLTLFGKEYTVSSDTVSATTGLVLFQSAQTVTLTQGGTTGQDSATVTINGATHTVKLINAGTSSATISVDSSAGTSVTSGSSRTINGVSVALTSVQSSTAGGNTAVVLVGAKKLTFKDGQQVTQGDNSDVILGTYAYITGGVGATTKLTVAVYAKDNSHDWIGSGDTFADPVFGSFGVTNGGLNIPVDDSSRETISVGGSGDTTLTLSMTDHDGNAATFDWATNTSSGWNLSTSSSVGSVGYQIYPYEMANLTLNDFFLTGTGANNQNTGHLLQLQTVYNDSSTATNDYVQFYDPIAGKTYGSAEETSVSEGVLNLLIDGRTYTVNYVGAAGSSTGSSVQVKYPTSDSQANTGFVLYPTILAKGGESVGLYEPLNVSLHNFDASHDVAKFYIPNGNGFTNFAVSFLPSGGMDGRWLVNGVALQTNATAASNYTTVTVGQLTYNFTSTGVMNYTRVFLEQPGATSNLAEPAIVMFEGKDQNNQYNAVVLDTKSAPAGTSSDAVGVNGIYFTSSTYFGSGTSGKQRYSLTKLNDFMDGFGTLVTRDTSTSAQPVATISYPPQQAYSNLYLGAVGSVSSGSGAQMVTDSQSSSLASGTNLIVVGGTCVNSVAASLLGVSAGTCETDWTAATGLGSGEFLIQSFASNSMTGGAAVLVAGTDAADTVAAASVLVNGDANGMKINVASGKKYTGVTSTSSATDVTSA